MGKTRNVILSALSYVCIGLLVFHEALATNLNVFIKQQGDLTDLSTNTSVSISKTKYPSQRQRPCPCKLESQCQRITTTPSHEVFVFSTSNKNWRAYDWTKITSLVQVGYYDDDITCYAHSKGVRVLDIVSFPVHQLTNQTARREWLAERMRIVNEYVLDGINLDFESEIDMKAVDIKQGLTDLTRELTDAVKSLGSFTQVTFDYAWSPDCVDNRCYDYTELADIVDFVVIMAYDERSQIRGECIAWANSAYNNTSHGLERYMAKGVSPDKLVLAVPWCGYRYPCESYNYTERKCYIKPIPYVGVNCSDAAGKEVGYGIIKNTYLPQSFSGRMWDNVADSPYFSYKNSTSGEVFQVWYDDSESLAAKYQLAGRYGLRGVSMWHADDLDYSDTGEILEFWGNLP